MLLSQAFSEALVLACRLHQAQTRKGTEIPYIAHLMAVASLVLEFGGTEEEAIAALLHDAVEDQGGKPTLAAIRRQFGDGVAAIVEGCSDTDVQPKPAWLPRKQIYLKHLQSASDSVLLVSAADKLHNAISLLRDYQDLGEELWERFHGGREGTLWYFRAIVNVYLGRGSRPIFRALDRVVAEVETAAGAKPSSAGTHDGR